MEENSVVMQGRGYSLPESNTESEGKRHMVEHMNQMFGECINAPGYLRDL